MNDLKLKKLIFKWVFRGKLFVIGTNWFVILERNRTSHFLKIGQSVFNDNFRI